MKNLAYLLFFMALSIKAQQSLQPHLEINPNLWSGNEDILLILEKNKAITEKMAVSGVDSLTEEEERFLAENEMVQNPFSTDGPGCSWYCAAVIQDVNSSSSLPDSKSNTYTPWNLHDFNLKTAWATNKNNGIGETIKLDFKPSEILSINYLKFYNGYQKSEASFKNNSRVKKAALYMNGEHKFNIELDDIETAQVFDLGKWSLEGAEKFTVELKILEIYPGEKYNDLCVSEINFDGEGDH